MADVLTRLRAAGVEFRLRDDGRLDFRGGTAADHESVRANRDELLDAIRRETAARNEALDPLGAFLRDPLGTPQETVDRLIAGAFGLEPHLLSSFNVALAWRAGLDPQDVFDAGLPSVPPDAGGCGRGDSENACDTTHEVSSM